MLGRWLAALCVVTWVMGAAGPAAAQDKVRVVATFSILADLARNVGGDAVDVTALVGPDSDAHAYSPSPADAKRLAAAKVVLVNGLGFEGWIERLVKASGTKAAVVVASKGVSPRQMMDEDHGKSDPHAWQSVAN
ncbi:MAG TPA: zinc ABC transporter substrate-binding protein, partial [Reyranella sp.]